VKNGMPRVIPSVGRLGEIIARRQAAREYRRKDGTTAVAEVRVPPYSIVDEQDVADALLATQAVTDAASARTVIPLRSAQS
jgi:hypothetical protein